MRVSALVFVALIGSVAAFSTSPSSSRSFSSLTKTVATAIPSSCLYSTAEAAETESTTEDSSDDDIMIPTNLPSDVGMDYIPLATMLATGQFEEADQVRK